MNLYDKIKSPFEDEETIIRIIKNFSEKSPHSSSEFYHHILRDNNETINNNLYMDCFDENIYWPLLENDWKNIYEDVAKNPEFKKIYDRFDSYQELFNYINQLDEETKVALRKYREYASKKSPDVKLVNKYKTILQEKTGNTRELITAYNLYRDLPQSHDFHSQDLMGFHFDSQLHDRTEKRENAEIKFYINAGEDSFKVAKLFLDKCRESDIESYYFKVVDPMYKEQERNDRLCIYSTIEHSKTFLEFLVQIQSENTDIRFRKPPLTAGVIDGFIGIGTDTLDNDSSYNQSIGAVIYNTLVEVCGENNIKQSDLSSYIESHPTVLENIKGRLIQKSVEKGCSKEKICVTDKLAEKLKTVEIADTTEIAGKVEHSKKTSSSVRKGNVQINGENGNIIIHEYINPDLLKRKIRLPSGNEISAKQYIQENFAPYIPESGTFKLKNGIEISARQFIEEFVMFDLDKYNGDLVGLMSETLATDDTPPERDSDNKDGQGLGLMQEQGARVNYEESLATDSRQARNGKMNSESFKESLATKRKEHRTGSQDVNKSRNIIALRRERDRLLRGENLSEEQIKKLNEINGILAGQQWQKKSNEITR